MVLRTAGSGGAKYVFHSMGGTLLSELCSRTGVVVVDPGDDGLPGRPTDVGTSRAGLVELVSCQGDEVRRILAEPVGEERPGNEERADPVGPVLTGRRASLLGRSGDLANPGCS